MWSNAGTSTVQHECVKGLWCLCFTLIHLEPLWSVVVLFELSWAKLFTDSVSRYTFNRLKPFMAVTIAPSRGKMHLQSNSEFKGWSWYLMVGLKVPGLRCGCCSMR